MGLVREISIGKHKDAPRYLQTALTDGSAVKSSQYTVRCVTCAVCDVWCSVVYYTRCNGAADAGLSRQGAEIGIVKGGRIIAAQITPIIN